MKFIATENITALLEALADSGRAVWAPQVIRDTVNTVLFAPFSGLEEISYDAYTNLSARHLLLPATEKLFSYRYASSGDGERIEIDGDSPEPEKTVIFGTRACDASAIAVLDALYASSTGKDYNDPGYRARRDGLAVITLACTTCDSACFCSSFENGPAEKRGSDMFLYPVEGGFLAQALTQAGKDITQNSFFQDSDMEPPQLAETARVDLASLQARLMKTFSDMDFWNRATENCLSCGYCTYSCPACYCFNIFDEMRSDREGERLRSWDSCMFHQYTRETSGHNPRPLAAHRYRNRLSHKFSYYPHNQGEMLCTGCGRCIRGCPAGVDLRDVLSAAAVYERPDHQDEVS